MNTENFESQNAHDMAEFKRSKERPSSYLSRLMTDSLTKTINAKEDEMVNRNIYQFKPIRFDETRNSADLDAEIEYERQ